jgi:hypothetical protein
VDIPGSGGDWISEIERESSGDSTKWLISLNTGGAIELYASSFRQYIRHLPVFVATPDQYLESTQRGGISFDTATPQT